MRFVSKHARVAWVLPLATASLIAGCFKPNVQDAGFICADGGVCPEGLTCRADGLCHEGQPPVCQATAPPIEPICTPDPGHDCDPVCQSRCDCGRCNLVGSKLDCTPAGDKARGALCDISNDDCAPGNICLKDCMDKIARCFRICGNDPVGKRNDVCPGQCNIAVTDADKNPTPLTICEPPDVQCNPVVDSGDCGDPALGCYILNTGPTACDCKGVLAPGIECGPYNSCIPGYSCVALSGGSGKATCLKTCQLGGPATDCAPGVCTRAQNSNFGYCAP
jgi:hypothetical protein